MTVFNPEGRSPARPDLVSALRDAKDIVDKAVPYEPNMARDDLTEIRKIAFSVVLRELLIAANPGRPAQTVTKQTSDSDRHGFRKNSTSSLHGH
jgi:hypothetical protein